MVDRILKIVHKEFSNIHNAAFLLGISALLSQLLGLVRDRSFASVVGPSQSLDIYYASFRIPDLMFNSVSTLVSVTVLLPFLVKVLQEKGNDGVRNFLSQMFTVFIYGMIILSGILFLLMPYLVGYVVPGFTIEMQHTLVNVSRLMLLSPILLGLSNLFGSITQMQHKFFVYALSPIFYNLGIIIGIYFLWPVCGIYGLAIGVLLGAFLHMAINLPVLARSKNTPTLVASSKIEWKNVGNVFLLSLPRTLALSLNSFALLVLTALASKLDTGSISLFNLSFNLQSVPIAIIGLSYGVAAFPVLSKAFSEGNMELYKNTIISTAKQILFFSLPVISLFVILRAHIVRVILGTGSFNWDHTRLTAASLALFTIAIIGQCFIILFVRAYYAAGKTRRPLVVNLIFTGSEIMFAYLFIHLFKTVPVFAHTVESLLRVQGVHGTVLLMLSLGYAVGTLLNGIALWLLFRNDFMKGEPSVLFKPFIKNLGASIIMSFVMYKLLQILSPHLEQTTGMGIFIQGFIAGIGGLIVWGMIHSLFKTEEFLSVTRSISKKFWKQEVVADDF